MNVFTFIDIQKESKTFSERKLEVKKNWVDKQKDYFKTKIKKYQEEEKKYDKRSDLLVALMTIFVLVMGLTDSFDLMNSENIMYIIIKCIMAIILVSLTTMKAKQYFDGYDKIIKQYEISLQNFERASLLLTNNKLSHEEYIKIIKKLGEEALIENSFWTLLRREREYKAPSLK